MPAQLLLINPKKKHRRKRRASARNPRRRAHRRNPKRRRRVHVVRINHKRRRHRRNPFGHRRRHRRVSRNPMGLNVNQIMSQELTPALLGAVGAVGMDIIYGQINAMLPASITGNTFINAAVKSAGAIGLGMLASKALGRDKGTKVAVGALTVITYELLSSTVKSAAPTLPMAGIGAYMPPLTGHQTLGAYIPRMGAYQPLHGLGGAYNPAPYLLPAQTQTQNPTFSPGSVPYGYAGPNLSGLDGVQDLGGTTGMGMF